MVLGILISVIVLILIIVAFWNLTSYTADLYKEAMIEDIEETPVGRSTKRQVALLYANKLRNNRNISCVDRRSSLKRNHIY